ncbi:hypothetical protein EHS25_002706 [Saitozyma podzolica]|uniref:C3HC-type domain-containing protein n=1 Tax=Saitozyma podzolica TaxID=1890683 RepID=A0A427YDL3_9TREE|nr:hypothetical protein EHS25_002706 [Saitozyma podzolica]
MSESPDPDLLDVFRLLYDEPEWALDDEVRVFEASSQPQSQIPRAPNLMKDVTNRLQEETPALEVAAATPDVEVEEVEADVEPEPLEKRYSKRRFAEALNGLFSPSKRPRIYTPLSSAIPSIIPSTAPLPTLPPPTIYAPFSPLPLLSRLRTFRPSTFTPSFSPLTPLELALSGWTNTAREEVGCGSCGAKYGVGGLGEIVDVSVRREVARRLGKRIEQGHGKGCAWRVRKSPRELFTQLRQVLHPMLSSSLAPLAERIDVECLSTAPDIAWRSPISSSPQQILAASLSRHRTAEVAEVAEVTEVATASDTPLSVPRSLSELAATLALFAWYPYHPNLPSGTLSPKPRPTEILQCRFCERRVGLWAFRPGQLGQSGQSGQSHPRTFDLVGEHLSWCPIRPQITHAGTGTERAWWDDTSLLQPKEKGTASHRGGLEEVKGWVRVSERLEKKPWRR